MKLVILLILFGGASFALYLFIFHIRKIDWKVAKISVAAGILMVAVFALMMITFAKSNGGWCSYLHTTNSYPPIETVTAMDFFERGNYEYDLGNCDKAIESYTRSIELEPNYPESYNNRAFTYIAKKEFDPALEDLNRAIELNPDYKNALMNRAGILNYHKNNKQAAIADYEKILSLIGTRRTNVCAYIADAKYGGNFFTLLFKVPPEIMRCR